MSDTLRGAGGDPYAEALVDNPYNAIPDVAPGDGMPRILAARQRRQRLGLAEEEDRALRCLHNRPSRLAWDLLTLGTTPEVKEDGWSRTRRALATESRVAARGMWPPSSGGRVDMAALHVRAVLGANELAWQTRQEGRASDAVLERFVALWSALLWRPEWIEQFARHRYWVWGVRSGPDVGDLAQFREKAQAAVTRLLEAGAGPEEGRLTEWSAIWDRERVAIEVVAKSWGNQDPAWPTGLGPLGLAEVGAAQDARAWLVAQAKAEPSPLPVTALREGRAGFYKIMPEQVATSAVVVQCVMSSLGRAAAEVWRGLGLAAAGRLASLEVGTAPGEDAWFGTGATGRRRLASAAAELHSEALLLQVREGLSRPEVRVDDLIETAGRLLSHAATLRQPQAAVDRLEELVGGRIRALTEAAHLPHPDEVERIVQAAEELRGMLLGRGSGRRCTQDLSQLLRRRAVATWNRARGKPSPRAQSRMLKDLFHAADLSPRNADVVANLANLIFQVAPTRAEAERRGLFDKAWEYVDTCRTLGGSSRQLDECRRLLLEQINPAAAMEEARRRLDDALASSADRSGDSQGAAGARPRTREGEV